MPDVDVDNVLVAEPIAAPYLVDQLAAREGCTRSHDHRREEVELRSGEVDVLAAKSDCASLEVDGEIADDEFTRGGDLAESRPSQHRADSRNEFARGERFDEVVVGSRAESDDLVDLLIAGGEDHDVRVGELTDLATDLDSVDPGEHEVEKHQCRLVLARSFDRCRPVEGLDDLKALAFEVAGDNPDQRSLVVDDEHANGVSHEGILRPGRFLHRIFMVRGTNHHVAEGMVNDMRTRRVAVACVLAGTMVVSLGVLSNSSASPRKDLQAVAAQVRDLQMQAEAAAQRAGEAQAKLSGITAQLNSIRNRSQREQADLLLANATIDDIARNAYASGGMDPTLEVLMADDPTEFLAQAAVMSQLEQTQIDQLRRAQTTRLRVAQTQAEITDKEGAAKAVRDDMDSAKQESDARLADAQNVLAGLQEQERQRLAKLAEERRQRDIAEAAAAAKAAQDAQAAFDSSSPGTDAAESGGGFSGGSRAQAAIQYALSQVGKPYSFSASPPSSWDCSKLTAAAWAQAGVGLTALSYSQWDETQRVPVSDIQPGDLVFYFGGGAHHVAMYIGDGKMVSASNPSDGVEITDFLGPWYGERFSGVGRVI